MTTIILIMIILLIMLSFVMKDIKQERLPKQSIIGFTGTLGSGKTYLAVKCAIAEYNKQNLKHKIYVALRVLPFRDKIKCLSSWKYPATMYSNIPVRIGNKKLATPLTKEMLLERGQLPEKCVVLIDEIGSLASQWDFDNPVVLENMEKFIRFFRHWLNGKMFVTDQVADNIVKPIRSRLGIIYNLHDFHRHWGFAPFFKVTAIPLLIVENSSNMIESSSNQEKFEDVYFFGYLPYSKKVSKKKYETRCYKPIYTSSALREIDHFEDDLYTRLLIDISVDKNTKKDYQNNKEKYKNHIYTDVVVIDDKIDNNSDVIDVDVNNIFN